MLKILMVFLSMLVDLAPHEKETSTTNCFNPNVDAELSICGSD